ncbi:MAG: hypothetical protein JXR60_00100 [Bacteroidales bacterium]|nr:hypothetical protein [Bacteroidales bacterium]
MIYQAIGFFLLSSVKFSFATLPISIRYDYQTALLISLTGGITGAVFFLYGWRKVLRIWQVHIVKKPETPKTTIKINAKRRRLIRIKNKYGYWGIILLTPSVLSIPIGALLLIHAFPKQRWVLWHLSLSVVLWGVVLISFFKLF